ncbi:5'-tyrosyl-DNA phosphodiesterase [Orchesella cincta]|uniref:5'-tyrosyl-DNA phosphodiesterase n=1 Tax=Orchesella cincta TaxID=48709 RepID=A0A1D2MI86_ORCCI|nr:5'-tyrosyl-DNA phosphodiesterase [Orchesella cincta]
MNLRDWEATGLIPENMPDLWVQNGSWLSTKYTWDLTENTNKQMPSDRQPRCRFDRFYMRNSVPKAFELRYFGLEGEDEVGETEMFPSDHWPLASDFQKFEWQLPLQSQARVRNKFQLACLKLFLLFLS